MVQFVVFIFLTVASVGFAEESPNLAPNIKKTEPQIEESQLNKSIPKEKQPTVTSLDIKTPPKATNSEKNAGSQENDTSQPVNANWWFNLLLVILTACLVLVGALQVRVYREQARYMREGLNVTGESAKAAQVGADAATVSAKVARDTLHLTQRAYIHFDHARLSQEKIPLPQVAAEIYLTCYFYNSGLTQGTLTTGYTDKIISSDTPEIPDYASHPNTWSGTETIPKSGEAEYPTSIRLETAEIETIKSGTIFFFYGYFTYRDIFDEKREIAFFMQYDPNKERFFKVHRPGYNYST